MRTRTSSIPLLALLLSCAQAGPSGATAAESGKKPEELVEECRSPDLFFKRRAEGELRRSGSAALPVLARSLSDLDQDLALRLSPIFRDVLRLALDQLDSDALNLARDTAERDALKAMRAALPQAIAKLREDLAQPRVSEADPEKERKALAEREEKTQDLRSREQALQEASESRLTEIETRMKERSKAVEEGRERIVTLGAAACGPVSMRRESVLLELLPFYDALLDSLRAGLSEGDVLPALPPPGAGKGTETGPAGARPRDDFERKRYLLSTVWAREVDGKGALAGKASPLLAEHLRRTIEDLQGPTGLVELAEDDLYALGRRGREILEGAAGLPGEPSARLKTLLLFRIRPRLEERTGIDFRSYKSLPFRDRRRLIVHYARVAGRDAIPTLRLIALDEGFEPSLRVRLAAAEALAGPNIRDRLAIRAFERIAMPELLKIPEIARDVAIISGHQLIEEKRYAEAVEDLQKVLDETPYDFRANYEIALAYLLLKNYQKAILHFEIARRVDPKDSLTLYNLACAYSLDGQTGKALEMLEASIKSGFIDFQHIESDHDLDPLRQDPRYHEILDRLREGSRGGEKREGKGEDR